MKINMIKVRVGDLVQNYEENDSTGRVRAWGGNLDVRPEYQREFVYDEKKRDAVINTVLKGFPLNIMYFVLREDGTYEVLDGQQRIISLCRFYNNKFSVQIPAAAGGTNAVNYPNLFDEYVQQFENYELQVYVCEGTDKEKLEWFEVINIAGEVLFKQEIRNALYHGAWLTDAKSAFSRRNCAVEKHYGKYLGGDCIRQKYLETALLWAADADGITGTDTAADYMQKHRHDENANDLYKYIEDVFAWVQANFGKYNKFMKGLPWGIFYNKHRDDTLDPVHIQQRIDELMGDAEVEKKSGIYQYILEGDEKVLNLRAFDDDMKQTVFSQQGGKCPECGKTFKFDEMEGDHIKPWSKGGKTVIENCQMLCKTCNRKKGAQ